MKNRLLFSVCFVLAVSVNCQNRTYVKDDKLTPREHNVDMLHLLLDVSFEPKIGKVIGNVALTFTPLQSKIDTLFLDAVNINIQSVKMGDEELAFSQNEKGITLEFANTLSWENQYTITIEYDCFPRKGIYFTL